MTEKENLGSKQQPLSLWFQLVLSVGVIAVSAASAAYTWQTWREYELERRAKALCEFMMENNLGYKVFGLKPKGKTTTEEAEKYVEAWLGSRACINQAIGRNFSDNQK